MFHRVPKSVLSILVVGSLGMACATKPPAAAAPAPVAESRASEVDASVLPAVVAPVATLAPLPAPVAPVASVVCDNDANADFDCTTLDLGECAAGEMYACPRKQDVPVGRGFRPGVAANIGRCYAATPGWKSTNTSQCVPHVEYCVRKAVSQACPDAAAQEACKSVLAWCSPEQQLTCAKVLSSQEPKLRAESLKVLRAGAVQAKASKSCAVTWDFNGYPFCPFCNFGR
jgi:hypothetical protein